MGRRSNRIISKVLIANRGEIAVRVARACADAGIESRRRLRRPGPRRAARQGWPTRRTRSTAPPPATPTSPGQAAGHRGAGPAPTPCTPATASCPRTPSFAQAVIDAGLVWIGPSPEAIDALGDKVKARHIAERAGAPLVPGTTEPVAGADEVVAFAKQYGLPVAIKAAYGGGGRGMKVARERGRRRRAVRRRRSVRPSSAFGRGECFVEKYLDKPRHVETQCIADQHGNVVVVSTRDCSLQRRYQKLVEEAPAPFLTDEQNAELYRASQGDPPRGRLHQRRHLRVPRRPGRHDLVPRGEHPPAGGAPGHRGGQRHRPGPRAAARSPPARSSATTTRQPRGHSFEFRINGEDAGRGFLPAARHRQRASARRPGRACAWTPGVVRRRRRWPAPSTRMLAKLIVTGADRQQALERARRALDEFVIEGMPTVLPFDRAVVRDEAFAPSDPQQPFTVHTRWIETEFDNQIEPYAGEPADAGAPAERERVVVEVGGKRLEVVLPAGLGVGTGRANGPGPPRPGAAARPRRTRPPAATPSPPRCRARS